MSAMLGTVTASGMGPALLDRVRSRLVAARSDASPARVAQALRDEGVVLAELKKHNATLAIVETFSSGQIAGRLAHLPGVEKILRRGVVARQHTDICNAVGLAPDALKNGIDKEAAEMIARGAQKQTGATHALAVIVDVDEGGDRIEFAGTTCLAIATADNVASRRSRIVGGRDWVRLGAVEMGLDCLRRYLQGLPVNERIDFEKTE